MSTENQKKKPNAFVIIFGIILAILGVIGVLNSVYHWF